MAPNSIFKKIEIYPYGICIALGILCCLAVLFLYSKKRGVPQQVQDYVFFIGIFAIAFGFLSAKFFQAVYNWMENGFKRFSFVGAGITAMGGFVGGAAIFLVAYFGFARFVFKGKKKGLHKKHFADLLAVAPICITIAHAFGRVGCLMAGCCHGKFLGTEYVFGGIKMEGTTNGLGYYVPTQLYEALFLFVLFAVLSVLYFKRCNIILPIYLISYATWRMIIEIFRADERGGFFLSLSPSQWMSILFMVIGVAMIIIYVCKKIPMFLPKGNKEEKTE